MTLARNYDDALAQIRSSGILVDHLEFEGKFARYFVVQDRKEKRGWTRLHLVPCRSGSGALVFGKFGVFSGDDACAQDIRWGKDQKADPDRLAEVKRLMQEADKRERARRAEEARAAAAQAASTWAGLSTEGESPYLRAKGVRAHGLRFDVNGTVAVVPLRDAKDGRIQALQYLRSKGQAEAMGEGTPTKPVLPWRASKTGHFHLIGPDPMAWGWVAIAEGYVTAASVHEATGGPVAMAVAADNLSHVAKALHAKYGDRVKLIFAADDDRWQKCKACNAPLDLNYVDGACPSCGQPHKARNAGILKAGDAAAGVGGRVASPSFADADELFELYQATGQKITDWNDLAAREGLPVVRAQWTDHLVAAGVKASPSAGNSSSTGEGGGNRLANFLDVEELLARYVLVYAHGGTVFDRQERILLPLSDVRDACADGKLVRAWQASQNREVVRVEEVGFDPTERDPKIRCNLFRGWPTSPLDLPADKAQAKCQNLLQGLLWLCGNDGELYDWVMRWLALPLQQPGSKMKSAVVIHGPQGTGKSTFFEAVAKIYGSYSRVLNQDAMEDKHNDWASRMLFAIADEVVARSEVWHVKNKLKGLITGDTIRINPKHMRAYDEANHCNLVFLSNEIQPVALDQDDRRHCVIWTPPKLAKDFYDAMHAEVQADGVAALHRVLLEFPLDGFKVSTEPPMTKAKRDLMALSADTVCAFAGELLDGSLLGAKPGPMLTVDAYRLYGWWCTQQGVRTTSMVRFVSTLEKKHGAETLRARWEDDAGRVSNPAGMLIWSGSQSERTPQALGRSVMTARGRIDSLIGKERTNER